MEASLNSTLLFVMTITNKVQWRTWLSNINNSLALIVAIQANHTYPDSKFMARYAPQHRYFASSPYPPEDPYSGLSIFV
jgi:hypothetical protein